MTVKELIRALSNCNQDYIVYGGYTSDALTEFTNITNVSEYKNVLIEDGAESTPLDGVYLGR